MEKEKLETDFVNLDDIPNKPSDSDYVSGNDIVPETLGTVASSTTRTYSMVTPVGLISIGLPTLLFALSNIGLVEVSIIHAVCGIILGGLLSLISGIMEFNNKNPFWGIFFCLYGAFWLSYISIIVLLGSYINNSNSMVLTLGVFFLIWTVVGITLYIVSFKQAVCIRILCFTMFLLHGLMCARFFVLLPSIDVIIGVEGLINSGLALYTSIGMTMEICFKKILPF